MPKTLRQNLNPITRDAIAFKINCTHSHKKEVLIEILSEAISFVPSEIFAEKNAEQIIFNSTANVPRQTISWYSPALSYGDSKSQASIQLLTREQETILFRQYNYAKKSVKDIQDSFLQSSTLGKQSVEALLYWHEVAMEKRDHIVECNLALVLAMAKRSWATGEYADLVAEGNIAMLRCIERFNCELGYKFSTYACRALTAAFNRFGKKQTKHLNHVRLDHEDCEEASGYDNKFDVPSNEMRKLVRVAIRTADAQLTSMEKDVLRYRFGLHAGHNPPCFTLAKAGEIMGISKERVRQIQMKALQKIQNHLESYLRLDLLAS